jgi:hypothetical protein
VSVQLAKNLLLLLQLQKCIASMEIIKVDLYPSASPAWPSNHASKDADQRFGVKHINIVLLTSTFVRSAGLYGDHSISKT